MEKSKIIISPTLLALGCYGVPSHEICNGWLCSRCKEEAWTAVSFTQHLDEREKEITYICTWSICVCVCVFPTHTHVHTCWGND